MKQIFVFILLLIPFMAKANDIINLDKEDGHYFFNSEINGKTTRIMLESAFPGLVIGDSIYNELFGYESTAKLSTEEKAKLVLTNKAYQIKHIVNDTIKIGDGLYSGKVFIVNNYNGVALPLQDYSNGEMGLYIDFQSLILSFIDTGNIGSDYTQYQMNITNGMPIISTSLILESEDSIGKLTSDFIVDFGNAALLYLMKGNPDVDEMLNNSGINLSTAYDSHGNPVSEGIYANKISIGGMSFVDQSIGVTSKLKSFQRFAGLFGLKVFKEPIILDVPHKRLLIKKAPQ
ncbi:hypothetical protein [uncultured Bacteroides sp.]|uniref:hypothetical protein n=1 Tax=uncultured Bacteroides sp. TaxID=162156 RepID=UPI00266EE95D|nr:hypothetical protein [uncultured Bacteroides sp.]